MPETMLISDETCLRLFLTLFHFLWQGAAIGLVVLVGESVMRGGTPKSRYALNFGALACMPVCVIATFLLVDGSFWTSITDNVDQPALAWGSSHVGLDEHSSPRTPENLPSGVQNAYSPTADSSAGSLAGFAGWSSFAARPISIGYGLCVGFLLLRVVVAICGGWRLRSTAKPTQDSRTLKILETQAKRMGLAIEPVVSYCQRCTVPAVIGIVRPVVLLPISLMGLETAHLSAIISHELAHIRRNDLLMNLTQRFVESFLFFHPVTWYLSRRVSVEREICCDEMVLASGSSNVVYAQALLEIAEQQITGLSSRVTSLAATGDNTSEFERRIQTILYGRPRTRLRLGRPVFLMLTCFVLAIPSVLHAWADDVPQASTVLERSAALRASLSEFQASGTYENEWQERTDEGIITIRVKGRFTWAAVPGKFLFKIDILEHDGIPEFSLGASFHTSNAILNDGETQLVLCKSKYISNGCEAFAFSAGSRSGYRVYVAFVPIMISPERYLDCFVRKELFEAVPESVGGIPFLAKKYDDIGLVDRFTFSDAKEPIYSGYERVDHHGNLLSKNSIEFTKDGVPLTSRVWSYNVQGEIVSKESIQFSSFSLVTPPDHRLNASAFDWCDKTRISVVGRDGHDLLLHTSGGINTLDSTIKEALDKLKAVEHKHAISGS